MSRAKPKAMFFAYVKDFLNDMRIELKSERTVETYRESLFSFRTYIFKQYSKRVDDITTDFVTDKVVREYIGCVAERNSVGTRNIRLAAIKAYVRYISLKNIEMAPLQISLNAIKHKTIHPKRNNWLNKEQVLLLLEQPMSTKIGVRDRFIMLFLFSTGARLNEMSIVKLKDIVSDEKYPYIRIMGKGNKPRIVPLPDEGFMQNYRYYLQLYHADKNPEAFLFYSSHSGVQGMMSEDNFQRILKKYGKAAQRINRSMPSVHPHLLRHSYGAQLYRLGTSLPEIAKLLGHEDISTTEIYAETDIDMTAQAQKKMIGSQPTRKWDGLSEDDKLKILGLK
jgi:site-specific recombinase XerD